MLFFRKIGMLLDQSPWRMFLLFFLLIAAVKWPANAQLPVWDESVSIFPAGEYLANHQFNVAGMLRDPECGAHWVSLMSFVTAAAMAVWGGGSPAWLVLHLLQWCLGAAACTVLMWMLVPWLGRWTAFLAALLFLAAPVTLGQLGCMYVEIPLALCSVAAVAAYLRGWKGVALLFCVLACCTKESGIVAAFALAGIAFLEAETRRAGLVRAFFYLVPGVTVVLVSAIGVGKIGVLPANGMALAARSDQAQDTLAGTWAVVRPCIPDHFILLALCLLLAILFLSACLWRPRAKRAGAEMRDRLAWVSSLFLLGFIGLFFVLIPLAWDNPNYIPRYLVQALPFAIILIIAGATAVCTQRIVCGAVLILILLSFANRDGLFYPVIPFNDMALAERSEEYVQGYAATRDSLAAVEHKVPPKIPVVMCPVTYLLTQHPAFGYVSKALPNVVNIIRAPAYARMDTAAMPDHFYLLYDYHKQGGALIQRLINVCDDPAFPWEVRSTQVFKYGMFTHRLVEVARKKKVAE